MATPMIFTQPQMNFLHEVFNIAGGNAAGVIEQMLQNKVDNSFSSVEVYPIEHAYKVMEAAKDAESCVYAQLTGDMTAEMLFILPTRQYRDLARQMRGVSSPVGVISDADIMTEFGNILMGAYITALYDFCRLDIDYSVPGHIVDMPSAILDEAIARQAQELACIVVIRNEFVISQMGLHALVLLIPTQKSLKTLVASIDNAQTALTGAR